MKKKVSKKVEEWLAYDDAIVLEVLGNKEIKVLRKGEEPLITTIKEFPCYTISGVPSRKIADIILEGGRDLYKTDSIEVEIENAIAEKYGL